MDMRSEIKKLARMEESPYPFLSLYLNTRWDDEQQRERIRLFAKNRLKRIYDQLKDREDWRRAFVADQQQIERFVEGLVRRVYNEEVNGIAIFSCSGIGTFLTYPSTSLSKTNALSSISLPSNPLSDFPLSIRTPWWSWWRRILPNYLRYPWRA